MTARWTTSDYRRDADAQQADHNAAMAAEAWDRDGWDEDERPTRRELEAEDFADWSWWREMQR